MLCLVYAIKGYLPLVGWISHSNIGTVPHGSNAGQTAIDFPVVPPEVQPQPCTLQVLPLGRLPHTTGCAPITLGVHSVLLSGSIGSLIDLYDGGRIKNRAVYLQWLASWKMRPEEKPLFFSECSFPSVFVSYPPPLDLQMFATN